MVEASVEQGSTAVRGLAFSLCVSLAAACYSPDVQWTDPDVERVASTPEPRESPANDDLSAALARDAGERADPAGQAGSSPSAFPSAPAVDGGVDSGPPGSPADADPSGDSLPLFCNGVDVLTDAKLPTRCAGTSFSVQLSAKCALDDEPGLRSAFWSPVSLPEGLELDEAGRLSGVVSGGLHALRVAVRIDGSIERETEFELRALDRCWGFALQRSEESLAESAVAGEEASLGAASLPVVQRLAAVRLDDPSQRWELPEDATSSQSVVSFETSESGARLVLVVEDSDGTRSLQLYVVDGPELSARTLVLPGSVRALAFSPNSERLALIVDAVGGTELHVADVGADVPTVVGSLAVGYDSELAWSSDETVLFLDSSTTFFPLFANPREVSVQASGLADPLTIGVDALAGGTSLFATPGGLFLHTSGQLSYFDRSGFQVGVHPFAAALSPSLGHVAYLDVGPGALRLHRPEQFGDDPEPATRAIGCRELLSWSQDGAHVLCRGSEGLAAFSLDARGLLVAGPAGQRWDPQRTPRVLISGTGRYVAFVDDVEGFFLQPTDSLGRPRQGEPRVPWMSDTLAWDFGVSPDERFVWVWAGPGLWVERVEAPADGWQLSSAMGQAPSCVPLGAGLATPRTPWCGATSLSQSVTFSRAGALLAFQDALGSVAFHELGVETPLVRVAGVPSQCESSCFALQ